MENYVIARNSRGLPVIVPLDSVDVELPPNIPRNRIVSVDEGELTILQYEDYNGRLNWCYKKLDGKWHYLLSDSEKLDKKIEVGGYKNKRLEVKKRKGKCW